MLFGPPLKGVDFLLALKNTHFQVERSDFARLNVLQVAVLAVPGAAQHTHIAGLDSGHIRTPVEPLPLVYDRHVLNGELPVEPKLQAIVD